MSGPKTSGSFRDYKEATTRHPGLVLQALRIEVKPDGKVELLRLLRGGIQPVRTVVRAPRFCN